jgi:hypothetical protein
MVSENGVSKPDELDERRLPGGAASRGDQADLHGATVVGGSSAVVWSGGRPGSEVGGSPGGWVRSVGVGWAAAVGTLTTKILAVAMAAATAGTRVPGMRSWTPVGAVAAGEPAGVLEDGEDLGGGQEDLGAAAAGAFGPGGEHLDLVAGSQALWQVAGVGADGQLDQAGVLAGGEQELGGDEGLAAEGCGEDPAGDRLPWGGPEVVAQGGGGQAGPYDHEVAAVQGRSGGQVVGGGVDGDQPLGAVQEGRAGEDGGQHQARTEGGAGVHPAGRPQALGGGRWERRGVLVGQGRRSLGGWGGAGTRCPFRA